ncbi:MAG: adenine deaminase, partial [Congregibacter sp.]|nr:adenine deaminase [Congregibacter sp.]
MIGCVNPTVAESPMRILFVVLLMLSYQLMAQSLPGFREETTAFSAESDTRRQLLQVSLGRVPADLLIRNVTLLNVFTGNWESAQDIAIAGDRIAWVGNSGNFTGKALATRDGTGLWAVPGFGESHKHIESSYLTPEYEAELVVPFGSTWTVEGS